MEKDQETIKNTRMAYLVETSKTLAASSALSLFALLLAFHGNYLTCFYNAENGERRALLFLVPAFLEALCIAATTFYVIRRAPHLRENNYHDNNTRMCIEVGLSLAIRSIVSFSIIFLFFNHFYEMCIKTSDEMEMAWALLIFPFCASTFCFLIGAALALLGLILLVGRFAKSCGIKERKKRDIEHPI